MINLIHGDCLEKLKDIPDNSIDSFVTDPPAGISFMAQEWDSNKGGKQEWIAWMQEVAKECLRVLKPGAHGLVWALPRTSHWTATALEDAGFEIRDRKHEACSQVPRVRAFVESLNKEQKELFFRAIPDDSIFLHIFGTGFPKSHDISKAIDKLKGAEREVIGVQKLTGTARVRKGMNYIYENKELTTEINITEPATSEAKQWQGFGTALKPASEHWILIRKPLAEKTVAQNVLKYGTGGLNIDACRIGVSDGDNEKHEKHWNRVYQKNISGKGFAAGQGINSGIKNIYNDPSQGRFPANFILSHNEDCEYVGTKEVKLNGSGKSKSENSIFKVGNINKNGSDSYVNSDGKETVTNWNCTDGCAVKLLDEQSGILISGTTKDKTTSSIFNKKQDYVLKHNYEASQGGASRFFYCSKASKSDKNNGLDDSEIDNVSQNEEIKKNTHPTVKSTKLMEYLIKLVTQPGGIVLDPFMGSGSTGVAAKRLGFDFIGIEKEEKYFNIAKNRIDNESEPEQLLFDECS